jgi:hypothetical protein
MLFAGLPELGKWIFGASLILLLISLVQPRTKQYRVHGTSGRPVYVHRNGLAV